MKWQVPKIWSGDCWIIGGGSSISEQFNIPDDLIPESPEEFKSFGDYMHLIHKYRVIGVNIAAFLGDWVDVAYWGDSDTYTEYRHQFDSYAGLKVSSAGKFSDGSFKTIKYLHRDNSRGITKSKTHVSWVSRNSGGSAVNLAYHLGATRIFILGLDMYSSKEGRVHWHTGYPDKSKTLNISQIKKGKKQPRGVITKERSDFLYKKQSVGWKRTANDAKKLGIEIINVNPKSNIDAFPKMSLVEVLQLKLGGSDEEI